MIKILFSVIMFIGFAVNSHALTASDYNVSVASYPITEVAFTAVEIANNINVEQMYFSNESTTTAQTISIYENCATTTTISLTWRGYIPAGADNNVIVLNYPLFNTPLGLTNACFRKSDAASAVHLNVHYR